MNSDKNVTRDNPASFKTEIPRAKTNIEGSVRFKAPLPPSMTAENVSESWPVGGLVLFWDFFFLPPPPHLTQNQNVNYFLVLIGFNYFFRRGWVGGGGNGTQLS